MSWTMEKMDASAADNFAVDGRLVCRSFMHIRKNSGPKIEPWGTPASIGDHGDIWPFKWTCGNLPLKKLLISVRSVPKIPVDRI